MLLNLKEVLLDRQLSSTNFLSSLGEMIGELKVLESKLNGVDGELLMLVGITLESIGEQFIKSSSSSYGASDTEVSSGLLLTEL